jgi:hypothetical protein
MAEMMPPAGAPKGMAPAPGSADSAAMRERAANAMMDKERARYEAMAAAAPKPTKPYSAKTVQTLIDTFNETIDKLGGQDLPAVEVELGGAERWTEPLPATIFVPLMALFQAAQQVVAVPAAHAHARVPAARGALARKGARAHPARQHVGQVHARGKGGHRHVLHIGSS